MIINYNLKIKIMFFYIFITIIIFAVIMGIRSAILQSNKNSSHEKDSLKIIQTLQNFKLFKFYPSQTSGMSLALDDENKKICILDALNKPFIYDYSQINQSEIQINGKITTSKSTSSIVARGIVGGVIGGNVGGIIGGLTSPNSIKEKISTVILKLNINDQINPIFKIHFLNSPTSFEKNNPIFTSNYNLAEKWQAFIANIIVNEQRDLSHNDTVKLVESNKFSVADELLKLKCLEEKMVISKEEFEVQKNKLLEK